MILKPDLSARFFDAADKMALMKTQFQIMEAAFDAKFVEIDFRIDFMYNHVEQLLTDGRKVAERV